MSLISVILPVYNQEQHLRETLTSILNQTYQEFELVVMDDGSTDNSAQIIREFANRDSRVKAYFEPNAGKSESTNKLVYRAKGDWCVFLDADDVMLPNRIEKQIGFHQANPSIHASSAYCQYINEKGNMFGTQRYPGLTSIKDYKNAITTHEFITCSYTCLMVARQVFLNTGGLRKNFEPCEDFEFFNRLADQSYILLIIPEVLMKYRIHPAAITVRKPILVLDTINYVKYCLMQRRAGKEELGFDAFMEIQQSKSWWEKMNRKRFNYSMIYFRSAGFAMLSKNYGGFLWQITASTILSPIYVLKKVLNHTKR